MGVGEQGNKAFFFFRGTGDKSNFSRGTREQALGNWGTSFKANICFMKFFMFS